MSILWQFESCFFWFRNSRYRSCRRSDISFLVIVSLRFLISNLFIALFKSIEYFVRNPNEIDLAIRQIKQGREMLEQLLIFTRGGLVLWSSCRALGNALKGSPIDALIRSCLLEERSADSSFSHESYTLKWAFHNELGLVFVAVYQRILHLLYVDDLLSSVRREFSAVYDPKRTVYDDFDETFRQLQKEAEARAEEMKKLKQSGRAPPVQAKKGSAGQRALTGSQGNGTKKGSSGSTKDDSDGDLGNGRLLSNGVDHSVKGTNKSRVVSKGKENGAPETGAFDVNKLKMRLKTGKKGDGDKKSAPTKGETKKAVKKNRVWDDSPVEESRLDFTDERGDEGMEREVVVVRGESMMDKEEVISSESEGEEEDEVEGAKPGAKKKSWFTSMFQR